MIVTNFLTSVTVRNTFFKSSNSCSYTLHVLIKIVCCSVQFIFLQWVYYHYIVERIYCKTITCIISKKTFFCIMRVSYFVHVDYFIIYYCGNHLPRCGIQNIQVYNKFLSILEIYTASTRDWLKWLQWENTYKIRCYSIWSCRAECLAWISVS